MEGGYAVDPLFKNPLWNIEYEGSEYMSPDEIKNIPPISTFIHHDILKDNFKSLSNIDYTKYIHHGSPEWFKKIPFGIGKVVDVYFDIVLDKEVYNQYFWLSAYFMDKCLNECERGVESGFQTPNSFFLTNKNTIYDKTLEELNKVTDFRFLVTLYKYSFNWCSHHNTPVVWKIIFDYIAQRNKNINVLVVEDEFGEPLIGFLSSCLASNSKYYTFVKNKCLYNGIEQIKSFYGQNKDINIINNMFGKTKTDEFNNFFDIVIISVPAYNNDKLDRGVKYRGQQHWLGSYIFPIIDRSIQSLVSHGSIWIKINPPGTFLDKIIQYLGSKHDYIYYSFVNLQITGKSQLILKFINNNKCSSIDNKTKITEFAGKKLYSSTPSYNQELLANYFNHVINNKDSNVIFLCLPLINYLYPILNKIARRVTKKIVVYIYGQTDKMDTYLSQFTSIYKRRYNGKKSYKQLVTILRKNTTKNSFVDITSKSFLNDFRSIIEEPVKSPIRIWLNDPMGLMLSIFYHMYPKTKFILVTYSEEDIIFPIDHKRTHVFSGYPRILKPTFLDKETIDKMELYSVNGDYWYRL